VWRQYISGFDIMEVAAGGDRAMAVIKKIKWPDKTKNLEMMGKLAAVGAFKERVEHTGQIGISIASDEDDL
jgi:phage terminase small subunit